MGKIKQGFKIGAVSLVGILPIVGCSKQDKGIPVKVESYNGQPYSLVVNEIPRWDYDINTGLLRINPEKFKVDSDLELLIKQSSSQPLEKPAKIILSSGIIEEANTTIEFYQIRYFTGDEIQNYAPPNPSLSSE